jgi:hypothetical protein
MPLKSVVTSLDSVPEAFRELYEADPAGGFVLKLDDRDYKAKISEMRETNVALAKNLKQFEGVDLETYKKAQGILAKVEAEEEKEMIRTGDFDGFVKRRTAVLQQQAARELNEMKAARDAQSKLVETYGRELSTLKIDAAVRAAVASKGSLLPAAEPDLLARARGVFRLDAHGKVTANPDIGPDAFGKNGEAVTIDEWAGRVLETAPHLFAPGKGGRAVGDTGSPAQTSGGVTLVKRGTPAEMGRHLDGIAKGTVRIVD